MTPIWVYQSLPPSYNWPTTPWDNRSDGRQISEYPFDSLVSAQTCFCQVKLNPPISELLELFLDINLLCIR